MIFYLILFFCLSTWAAGGVENSVLELSSPEDLVSWAGYGEEKLSTVVINGKVICREKAPTDSHPISGASVAVFCGTSGQMRESWAESTTDGQGEFLIDLPSHLHAIPNLERICIVEVLLLPKSSPCRHSFTRKHKGIKLTSIGEGIRTYATDIIHLMSKPSQVRIRKGDSADVVNVM